MYSARDEIAGSQQDQLAPPPDQLASASPKQIIFKYKDWGKPINYKLNNLNSNVAPQDKTHDQLPQISQLFDQPPKLINYPFSHHYFKCVHQLKIRPRSNSG